MPKPGILKSKSMFCVIYRSSKRDQTYLYVEKKDDFSRVPEELMKGFGQPQLAMILPLDGRKKLVNADIEKVKQALTCLLYTSVNFRSVSSLKVSKRKNNLTI